MTAMAENVHAPQHDQVTPVTAGVRLRLFTEEYVKDNPNIVEKIQSTIWAGPLREEDKLNWSLILPDRASDTMLNTYLITSLVRAIHREARELNGQIDHQEIPAITLEIGFLYDSLRDYAMATRHRGMTPKELSAPLNVSKGMIIDSQLARAVRSHIHTPPPYHEAKPGQIVQLHGYYPAILAVHGIMYAKQLGHARSLRPHGRV